MADDVSTVVVLVSTESRPGQIWADRVNSLSICSGTKLAGAVTMHDIYWNKATPKREQLEGKMKNVFIINNYSFLCRKTAASKT